MMQNSRHASLQNVYPRKNPGCDSHEKDITLPMVRTKGSLLLRGEQHEKYIAPPVVRTKSSPLLREQYPRMTDPQKTPDCASRDNDVPVPHVKDIFKFRKSAADSATELTHYKEHT